RAAVTVWNAMVSRSKTAEKVLLELLCGLEDWPLHSTPTSNRNATGVFALAVSNQGALWAILQLHSCPRRLKAYSPHLFLALVFQVFFSAERMPGEVNTFWKECQEEGCLP
ncbi:hypothetical protein N340_02888, partial [Tauraco erythrolophus]